MRIAKAACKNGKLCRRSGRHYRLRVWAGSSGQLAMTLPESPESRKQRYDAV